MTNLFPADATIIERREISQREQQGWGRASYSREAWRDGPWKDEPDIVKWIDSETGLQCLILRNTSGTLCGYVGVTEGHPWWKVDYNGCVNRHEPKTFEQKVAEAQAWIASATAAYEADPSDLNKSALDCATIAAKPFLDDAYADSFFRNMPRWACTDYEADPRCDTPERVVNIHGGLTFSGDWDKYFPDSQLWFMGFDCGHHMDFSPGMDATTRELDTRGTVNPWRDPNPVYDVESGSLTEHGLTSTYRTLAYVKAEVESLAKQLHAMEVANL